MSLRPVGKLPSSVYWRRRLLLLVPLLVLVGVVAYACAPAGRSQPTAAGSGTTAPGPSAPRTATGTAASSGSAAPTPTSSTTPTAAPSAPSTGSTAPAASTVPPAATTTAPAAPAVPTCAPTVLQVTAATSAPVYPIGGQPVLSLQVANTGAATCLQDIADPQVELTVYQGENRVWGSHDCAVQPGTNLATLTPGGSVAVSITWQGTTSVPGCAAARTAVPAGTYTLRASLAGVAGTSAPFAFG